MPNPVVYTATKILYRFRNRFKINNHFIRNELKNAKGPAIVLCNHVSSFDHVADSCATLRHMNFVVAESTYYSKFHFLLKAIRVITKQQFFSVPSEFRQMREVIRAGGIILMFPAGLCTSDGVTTTLPAATGSFLKFLGTDVYVMMSHGMYLSNPKWSKVFRKGRVETDCYKLFSREKLAELSQDEIYQIVDRALQYDEYAWQKEHRIRYRNMNDSRGLENVLYSCPHCKTHFSIRNIDNALVCMNCHRAYQMDEYGFFRKEAETDMDHPAAWHRKLLDDLRQDTQDAAFQARAAVQIRELNKKTCAFEPIGNGEAVVTREKIQLFTEGQDPIYEEETNRFFSLPMIPGEYFDLQNGKTIYRCYPKEPKEVAYITDVIIALYENRTQNHQG